MLEKLKKLFRRGGTAKQDLCVEGDITCERYVDLMTEYMEEELSPEDTEIWERHFNDCEHCSKFFKSFKSSVELVEHLQEEACPQAVAERLERFVAEQAAVKQRSR